MDNNNKHANVVTKISSNTIIKIIPDINAPPGIDINAGARKSIAQLCNLHTSIGRPIILSSIVTESAWSPHDYVHKRESTFAITRTDINKEFDKLTKNESRLLKNNFIKIHMNTINYYLMLQTEKCNKIYVTQENLKVFMKVKFGIYLFRNPDEAYITIPSDGSEIQIKILEKKELGMTWPVEPNLLLGPPYKREYNLVLGDKFIVSYAFCVNLLLKKKIESKENRYIILNQILRENEIPVFFGNDWNYFAKLDEWLQIPGY